MNSRINPSSSLRNKHTPLIGCIGFALSVRYEFGLVAWEMLQQQCRQIAILSKIQQVLHMQRIDLVDMVIIDDIIAAKKGSSSIDTPDPIHCEASRQACNSGEE